VIEFLTLEQVLYLHDAAIEKFGGLRGVRDANLLASAIEMPKLYMFGEELHLTLYDKASAYLFNIVCGHPFNDGNKRTRGGSAYLFLRLNNARVLFESYFEDERFEKFVLKVSKSKMKKKEIAYFLEHGRECNKNAF
jgi:death-on-curing protein